MTKKQRDLYEVMRVIERRYGSVADTLLELFHDHNAIFTVEELSSYGDDDAEINSIAGSVNLEAARFGAYATFLEVAKAAGIDGEKLFSQFSDAHAYWGDNFEAWEVTERARNVAESYVKDGKRYLQALREAS